MKVIVDGKEVPVQNDVKIIYDADETGSEEGYNLHVTATDEGIVLDEINPDPATAGTDAEVVGTNTFTIYDLRERIIR